MLTKKIAMTTAALAAAGAIVAGGAAISNASTENGASNAGYALGYGSGTQDQGAGQGRGGHTHTAVTGDELTKVTATVKAKDSAITVSSVQKDPDGSYDVHGTKAGARVMVEVSKDLATIEVRTGGPGQGGRGGSRGPGASSSGASQGATATPSSSAA